MADERPSWWTTLPGILTGVAALITAIAGAAALLLHERAGQAGTRAPAETAAAPATAAPSAASDTRPTPHPAAGPAATARPQADAGHLRFTLLASRLTAPDEDPSAQRTLQVTLRVTDIAGIADYIDGNTVRLEADGAVLHPRNAVNVAVYERQSAQVEAVFTLPTDLQATSLVLGREGEATTRLPLDLHASTPHWTQ